MLKIADQNPRQNILLVTGECLIGMSKRRNNLNFGEEVDTEHVELNLPMLETSTFYKNKITTYFASLGFASF